MIAVYLLSGLAGLGLVFSGYHILRSRPKPISSIRQPDCICGSYWVSAEYEALTNVGTVVVINSFTCPKVGCPGNIAEKNQEIVDKWRSKGGKR